jgi:small nuclear ribonucleoprotein (snRNP)-like protein
MKARNYVLEKQQETPDSQREARGLFLGLIPDVAPVGPAPQVISELWPVFWSFLIAVVARFKDDLLPDNANGASTGEEAFVEICVRVFRKQEPEFWVNNGLGSILTMAFGHVRQKLQPTLATNRTHVIDPVKRSFQNWKRLMRRKETRQLRDKLNQWSRNWNLDADWCRDHVLNVFRDLLFDDSIQWGFLYPDPDPWRCSATRAARLIDFWKFEARHTTGDASVSRFILSNQVYRNGNEPEPFVFRLREFNFEAAPWRYLREERAEYQKEARLNFRIHLHRTELERLEKLKSEKITIDEGFENTLTGVLGKFDRKLNTYMSKMTKRKSDAQSRHNLVAVRKKEKALQHFQWSVKFQVYGESLANIARSDKVKPNTVSEAVDQVLRDVDLLKRRLFGGGRRQGSNNRESAKTRAILRGLGR